MIPEWLSFWNEVIPSPYVPLYFFIWYRSDISFPYKSFRISFRMKFSFWYEISLIPILCTELRSELATFDILKFSMIASLRGHKQRKWVNIFIFFFRICKTRYRYHAKFNTKVANRKMQTEKSGAAAHAYLIWRERERLRIIERFHMTSR